MFGSSFSPVQTCPGAQDWGVWELTPRLTFQPDWGLKTGVKLVPVVQPHVMSCRQNTHNRWMGEGLLLKLVLSRGTD